MNDNVIYSLRTSTRVEPLQVALVGFVAFLAGMAAWAGWSAGSLRSAAHGMVAVIVGAQCVSFLPWISIAFGNRSLALDPPEWLSMLWQAMGAAVIVATLVLVWLLVFPYRAPKPHQIWVAVSAWFLLTVVDHLVAPTGAATAWDHTLGLMVAVAVLVLLVSVRRAADGEAAWAIATVALALVLVRVMSAVQSYYFDVVWAPGSVIWSIVSLASYGGLLLAALVLVAISPSGRRAPYGLFVGGVIAIAAATAFVRAGASYANPREILLDIGADVAAVILLAIGVHIAVLRSRDALDPDDVDLEGSSSSGHVDEDRAPRSPST